MRFGLKETLLNEIISALKENTKIKKAVIFGSRARGDFKAASDVDIAVFADSNLTSEELNIIRDRIDEIDCIYKFDIVDANGQDKKAMLENIANEGVVLFSLAQNN